MITRPSDPDGWYDPDKPAPVPDGTRERGDEDMNNRWQAVAGDLFRRASELEVIKIKSDTRIAGLEAEIARLTAINTDLCAVNLRHAEESARIAERPPAPPSLAKE